MILIRLREAIERHSADSGKYLTYDELASLTGLSKETLQSIASRSHYNTTLATVEKLCRALNCTPGDLLVMRDHLEDGGRD